MAINVSPTHTELINTLPQIIHSLQQNPENYTISLLNMILPFFRIALQTIANSPRELPKELQWCRKVQAIAALEESSAHISAAADCSPNALQPKMYTKPPSVEDELITELTNKSSTFKEWTSCPDLFWQQAAHPLQLSGSTLDQRLKAFCEHAAGQKSEVEILNFIRRLDSVIAYLEYKRRFPWAYSVSQGRVAKFLEQIQIAREQTNKYREFLLTGRRRLQFCHLLSKDGVDFKDFHHNDTRYDDVDYGVLFLDLDDRMWDSSGYGYTMLRESVQKLKAKKICTTSENSGARLAAKILLQSRRAFLQQPATQKRRQAPSDEEVDDGSKRPRTDAGSDANEGAAASKTTSPNFEAPCQR
ncbi:hypothetical protein ACQKWADRAFT_325688 [Trichoderma austrokoningii]